VWCKTESEEEFALTPFLFLLEMSTIGRSITNISKGSKLSFHKQSRQSLLEKLDAIEISNENEVINVDREDDSAISCVEAKCTVHLILIGLVALA